MRHFALPCLAVALVAAGCSQSAGPSSGIAWETNFQDALGKAGASNKLVMVDFYAEW